MIDSVQQAQVGGAATSRPTVLMVRAKRPTPELAQVGFTVVSAYVEQFWQSALGPTSTALIRHLARHRLPIGDESAGYVPVSLAVTRTALGIGRKGQAGRSGPLFRSIDRLARFGFLTVDSTEADVASHVTIVTHVGGVPYGLRRHWPDELVQRHDAFIGRVLGPDDAEDR